MKKIAFFISVLLMTSPAQSREFGTFNGFTVAASEADEETAEGGFCGIIKDDYEGPGSSRLLLFRYLENPDVVAVVVDNFNWSIAKGDQHEVRYLLGDFFYDRTAVGTVDSYRKGLLAIFPADDFLPTFARSGSIMITKGDTTVDHLSLTGSSNAVDAFGRCWQYVRADQAVKQAKRDRFKTIPKDPFK
jgi:hypothetical protein